MKRLQDILVSLLVLLFLLIWTALATSVLGEDEVVGNAAELAAAIARANAGGAKTILLEDGVYTLDDMLWVEADGVTVRSLSGNRDAVIIEGRGMNGYVTHVFNVAGSDFTVRDVTLRRVSQHAVQLQIDVDSVLIQNVHILDTGEQMVKVAYDPDHPGRSSDSGIMEQCLLEYSAGIGPQWYIGGIDAHNAKDWVVRDNTFMGIRSPSRDVAEFAIHFWSDSEDTLVERNTVINCDRGIGFGLGDRGHVRGIIRNNMIYHDSSEGFADVGIALESTTNAQVYNNTIYHEQSYPNAIEYRFRETTGALIVNNLTNRAISRRDGASGTLSHNVTDAEVGWFVDPAAGDLHLGFPVSSVVDQGQVLAGLSEDFDQESRPQDAGIDIGADEYPVSGPPRIITHPADQRVNVGRSATFRVVASGTRPLNYQWQKNLVDIEGATAATYKTPPADMADNGATFGCMVNNAEGSVASNEATLTVRPMTALPGPLSPLL